MPLNKFKLFVLKWREKFVFVDEAIYFMVVISLGIFHPNILMIGVYLLLYPYLFFSTRKSAFNHLYVSSIIALIWMFFANNQYNYNREMMTIFGLNSYPLFAWASGLFATYLIYSYWEYKFKITSLMKQMMLFVAFYWPIIIFVETIGYHIFNIKNLSAAAYAGLPICNCIHAPVWVQISYFALGPIYFLTCKLIGLRNPYNIKKIIKNYF